MKKKYWFLLALFFSIYVLLGGIFLYEKIAPYLNKNLTRIGASISEGHTHYENKNLFLNGDLTVTGATEFEGETRFGNTVTFPHGPKVFYGSTDPGGLANNEQLMESNYALEIAAPSSNIVTVNTGINSALGFDFGKEDQPDPNLFITSGRRWNVGTVDYMRLWHDNSQGNIYSATGHLVFGATAVNSWVKIDDNLEVDGYIVASDGTTLDTGDISRTYHAEIFMFNNLVALDIESQNEWHATIGFTQGNFDTDRFNFITGISAIAIASADAGGGQITITSNGHGLNATEYVTLVGWSTLDGVYVVESRSTNEFNITATWPGADETDANSRWNRGSGINAKLNSGGLYHLLGTVSAAPSFINDEFEFCLFINDMPQTDGFAFLTSSGPGDFNTSTINGLITITDGDYMWYAVRNVSAARDFTIKHGNVTLVRID